MCSICGGLFDSREQLHEHSSKVHQADDAHSFGGNTVRGSGHSYKYWSASADRVDKGIGNQPRK